MADHGGLYSTTRLRQIGAKGGSGEMRARCFSCSVPVVKGEREGVRTMSQEKIELSALPLEGLVEARKSGFSGFDGSMATTEGGGDGGNGDRRRRKKNETREQKLKDCTFSRRSVGRCSWACSSLMILPCRMLPHSLSIPLSLSLSLSPDRHNCRLHTYCNIYNNHPGKVEVIQ